MNHPNNMILMQIPWVLVILLKWYEWKNSHEILQDFDAIVWMIHYFVLHLTIFGYFKLKKMHKTTKTNRKMLVKLA